MYSSMSVVGMEKKNVNNATISFWVNGKCYSVDGADPLMSFNSWLRSQPGLRGTKVMCEEGGCGCCVVALEKNPGKLIAVNSCLMPLCSVDGCSVITTEGIGSRREGFHQLQSRLAEFGGSQCGYCTPGFVMSMYSLLSSDSSPTQQKVEDNFDGNICRCTGYRPILDAMKSFACDADTNLLERCRDIEDLGKPSSCNLLRKVGENQEKRCLEIGDGLSNWIRPSSLSNLKSILKSQPSIQLICGNTSTGIYKRNGVTVQLMDVSQISELNNIIEREGALSCGAAVSLNRLAEALSKTSSDCYQAISDHLKKIASVPIRNVGSWAGNLMVKHAHRDFPSDVFVLLEAVHARITIFDAIRDQTSNCSAAELMNINMTGKVIIEMTLNTPKECIFRSFKIMPRSQNAHAHVNAAFLAEISDSRKFASKPNLVFGGISSAFVHATKTEEFLAEKPVDSETTLSEALSILSQEIQPVQHSAADATVKYKHDLALGLFYKFYLSLCDVKKLGPGIESGVTKLKRPISKGKQTFEKNSDTFPVSEAVPKLSSKVQASGEAIFISDKIPTTEELHCAFVTSQVGNADIDAIDETDASNMKGFVQIIKGCSLPSGVNNTHLYPWDITQPLLAVDHVDFAGQPVAIVIAETSSQARAMANAVKVSYKNLKKPLLTVQDAIKEDSFFVIPDPVFARGDAKNAIQSAKHMVSGEIHMGHQYHFYMETQIARAETTEEGGFKLECATQAQKWVQDAVSFTFGTSVNKIEVSTKRIGGAYGGKSTNSLITSCAAALAAYCTKRPVCFHADLKTCMTTFGTRTPFSVFYSLGFDDDGVVQGIDCRLYTNSGPTAADGEADDDDLMKNFADSAYFCPNRRFERFMCRTNIPSTTWCRAPGSLQLSAFADQMMEHISSYLGKDPILVKRTNVYKEGQLNFNNVTIPSNNLQIIFDKLMAESKIHERQEEITTFNRSNKWKKKGLALSPMKYRIGMAWGKYTVLVSICAGDGTVIVSHGGIESGQGIHTKVAQVAAFTLGIPVEDIMVQRTHSMTSANSEVTGGSITSEVNCKTVIECCEILKARIEPIRSKMAGDSRWRDIVDRCYREKVDLTATCMWFPSDQNDYNSYGVTASEVEVDMLTGEYLISRVDTIFDCGISLNPSIDIGQVEGAFVMGLGFWLTENIVIDEESGRMLTDGTWEYKPPSSKDIPIEWNIELLANAPNPVGVLRSKASGEPPMCMAISVLDALKRAIESSKLDRGLKDYFQMPTPSTVEQIFLSSKLDPVNDFTLH